MSSPLYLLATLEQFVGSELGLTDFMTISQERIQAFADCTEDRQWIHVDVERATQEGPFGAPIAHGLLTLSLLPHFTSQVQVVPRDVKVVLNYGYGRVRFVSPVRSGARIRDRIKLGSVARKEAGRVLISVEHTVEIEQQEKPALVAESLLMLLP
ncbi:MAG: MaoC family dehydratase [Myxococcales bacterium]